jgi:uncharacterized protein (TIGR03437 family)
MFPRFGLLFAAALALLPVLAVAQPAITNGSFDTPNVGPCPNFQFKPTGAAWVFSTANDAGITTGGCGQKYTAPALPSGATQAGFIQTAGPNAGTISQTVSGFVAGQNYTITFYAAGRPAGAGCFDNCTELNFSVLVGQTDVLDVVNPPTNAFQQYTTKPFTASGDVTITFEATNPTSTDETSFITLVSIQGGSGPPPPAEPVIANPAFGTPSVGSCPSFQFNPTGATWVFTTQSDAGITTGGCGGNYHAPALPSGATQAGFIQTDPYGNDPQDAGTISQTVSGFAAGHNYTISFYAAGRAVNAGCTSNDPCTELNFSVFVNRTDVLDVVNPPTNSFQQYTTDPFTASGDVTITFAATSLPSIDSTSFITLVTLQDLGGGGAAPAPSFHASGVVNGASFASGGIVPGEIATVFGTNLTNNIGINLTSGLPLVTNFLNASVLVDGKPAPLFAVDNVGGQQQINFQVPWEVSGEKTANVAVSLGDNTSPTVSVPVLEAQPGIISYAAPGGTFGVILHADYQLADVNHPVNPGEVVLIYCTGLGEVNSPPGDGAASNGQTTVVQPSVTIGGTNAPVQFSGLAADFVGLYQVNVQVPSGLASGNRTVVMISSGVSSSPVLLPVQ